MVKRKFEKFSKYIVNDMVANTSFVRPMVNYTCGCHLVVARRINNIVVAPSFYITKWCKYKHNNLKI